MHEEKCMYSSENRIRKRKHITRKLFSRVIYRSKDFYYNVEHTI